MKHSQILVIIIAYMLVLTPSCKTLPDSSNAKEVRTAGWLNLIPEGDVAGRELMENFVQVLGELSITGEDAPFVVVNNESLERRIPSFKEVLGTQRLRNHEEMFYGFIDSRFVYSVVPRGLVENGTSSQKRKLRILMVKHDTTKHKTAKNSHTINRSFERVGGEVIELDFHQRNKNIMAGNIIDQMHRFGTIAHNVKMSSSYEESGKRTQHRLEDDLAHSEEGLKKAERNLKTLGAVGFLSFVGVILLGLSTIGAASNISHFASGISKGWIAATVVFALAAIILVFGLKNFGKKFRSKNTEFNHLTERVNELSYKLWRHKNNYASARK